MALPLPLALVSSISSRTVVLGAAMLVAAPSYGQSEMGPVYLAYAGPHSSSPASAFGHLFLLLAESDEVPLPLWDVVSFAADTEESGALRFLTAGIAGGFSGSYERLKFHEKSRDYEALDDRDLWLLELNLSHEQRFRLTEAISATAGAQYPYTFFVQNCAYYLQKLLAEARLGVSMPSGPTSPTGVWRLLEEAGVGGETLFRPATSRRLKARLANLRDPDIDRLKHERWEDVVADTAWSNALDRETRFAVSDYFAWRTLHRRSLLPEAATIGISFLRALAAADTSGPRASPDRVSSRIGDRVPSPAFHRYSRISAVYATGVDGARVHLRFRPALHDAADPWLAHRPVNTLEFLTLEISGQLRSADLRLERLVLFSQRSLTAASWLNRRTSWMLEAQIERPGLLGDGLQAVLRGGTGGAATLGPLHGYGLLTTGATTTSKSAAVSIGIESGLLLFLGRQWRSGATWAHERNLSEPIRLGFSRGEIWVRRDLTSDAGVRLAGEWTSQGANYFLTVDWYPR